MNWRLIFTLSLLGLVMGVATVYFIPSNIEPLFWLACWVAWAWVIASRAGGRYFMHGLAVALVATVWILAAHLSLFQSYAANHPKEMAAMASMGLPTHPRQMMIINGLIIGLIAGVIVGLLALLFRRFVRPRAVATTVTTG
jgi:hypothetical protein